MNKGFLPHFATLCHFVAILWHKTVLLDVHFRKQPFPTQYQCTYKISKKSVNAFSSYSMNKGFAAICHILPLLTTSQCHRGVHFRKQPSPTQYQSTYQISKESVQAFLSYRINTDVFTPHASRPHQMQHVPPLPGWGT